MVECNLKKKEILPRTADTADGVKETIRYVLTGKDKDLEVEWRLTLKYEGTEMPSDYKKVLGKHMSDEVRAVIASAGQQTELD